jgi:proteic killer suppression protein
VRKYGDLMAFKISQRIQELKAGSSVEELIQYSVGRCHALLGNRSGEYAMDLVHPHRLVFKKVEIELKTVIVVSIEDYH